MRPAVAPPARGGAEAGGRGAFRFAVALSLALLAGCAQTGAPEMAESRQRSILPLATDLAPGLAVTYYDASIQNVSEIPGWTRSGRERSGPPLPQLNYKVGGGEVLTSGRTDGVIAVIEGYIRFPETGSYALAVESNDGVSLALDGRTLIEDPAVHGDRLSDPEIVEVTQPGWHPLDILYFERRNAATLVLYWQPPGADSISVVPAEAFGHRP